MPLVDDLSAYLRAQAAQASLKEFVFHVLVSALLCGLLARSYVAFGAAASNRQRFARVFVLLGITTTLIVTVIQTSLALSLGLVGALSIVRFRGAIKEPEELAYLFACIAIGLGVAARQELVVALCTAALLVVIYLNYRARREPVDSGLVLTVSSAAPEQAGTARFVEVLKRNFSEVILRRLDEAADRVDAVFVLPTADYAGLEKAKKELLALSQSVRVVAVDDEGLF